MRKKILFLFLISSAKLFATHIIGGTLTYVFNGGSSYTFTQHLYRDCNPNNAALPATVSLYITNASGNLVSSLSVPLFSSAPVNTNYVCITTPPNLCMEEGIYVKTVNNLPPLAGGYHVFCQMCCRSANLINVQNPLNTGDSWYTYIPDNNIWLYNNSPYWSNQPTVYICQNQPVVLQFQALDVDGDSIVHSWYTPYSDPYPTFPNNVATFIPLTWNNGFSQNNPCGGPNWTINPLNGIVTGTPPNAGVYVIGVRAEEYRNGIKIGEIIRDYNIVVNNCGAPPVASFATTDTICLGQTSFFTNTSLFDSTQAWDFGEINLTTDTSSVQNPNYLYTSAGTYIVTLIINPGQAYCSDTASDTISVQVCSGVTENEKTSFSVYPNPVQKNSVLSLGGIPQGSFDLEITDMSGRLCLRKTYHSSSSEKEVLVPDLKPGPYFITLIYGTRKYCAKLFVF